MTGGRIRYAHKMNASSSPESRVSLRDKFRAATREAILEAAAGLLTADGAVKHTGDNRTGQGEGDDERLDEDDRVVRLQGLAVPRADAAALEDLLEAERLGYDSFWTAEAYGSDALTPLAWWGSRTERIKLGTSIVQLSARTPAATAMAAITLDHLSGGRFVLGLGVSGPQVVEGWYGQPYPRPLARTREYIDIVRMALARKKVQYDGEFFTLPLPNGPGKALQLTVRPVREEIPIYLAAIGPKNLELAGEIADGWLPMGFVPGAR